MHLFFCKSGNPGPDLHIQARCRDLPIMKLKYAVNLHKGLTGIVVITMMFFYDNVSLGPLVYLALHGTYGIMWLLKDRMFPDKQWEQDVSLGYGVFAFAALLLYWIAPWYLISYRITPTPGYVAASVALTVLGTMLHFGSDAQKYFTLKYKAGLITEGFFRTNRNTNYLGEFLIYAGFALLTMSWIGFIGLTAFFVGAFVPNMMRKDKSLSRYSEFAAYKAQTWLFIPRILP
jgi:protein-S-isoprenylcysteine O-methyltransferase Ste14